MSRVFCFVVVLVNYFQYLFIYSSYICIENRVVSVVYDVVVYDWVFCILEDIFYVVFSVCFEFSVYFFCCYRFVYYYVQFYYRVCNYWDMYGNSD